MNNAQGADGVAHLTYYDKEHSLSFVYDGTVGPWIDVAYGGYAEGVIARIPYHVPVTLASFQTVCVKFVDTIYNA